MEDRKDRGLIPFIAAMKDEGNDWVPTLAWAWNKKLAQLCIYVAFPPGAKPGAVAQFVGGDHQSKMS